MATYTITQKQVNDNYAVVRTLTSNEIEVGQTITISGIDATWNGAKTVLACPEYLFTGIDTEGDFLYDTSVVITNQVLFALTTDDLDRSAATGTITYAPTCTWIVVGDVEDWLGFTVTNPSADYDTLTMAVAAGNQFAYRRRVEAGYFDSSLSTVPSGDVKLGTVMYAASLYKQRGSLDVASSYDALAGTQPITGSMSEILRLLGVNRPAVA